MQKPLIVQKVTTSSAEKINYNALPSITQTKTRVQSESYKEPIPVKSVISDKKVINSKTLE
jgi:hypothetical protein